MRNELTYEQVKNLFYNSSEWENDLIESKTLEAISRQKSIQLIINKLDSKDAAIRYIASHMIIEFKIEEAKQKLIERIKDSETLNYNGTMTYALEHLNCQHNLKDIFEILATQSYESKIHAYNILIEQQFEFTKEDIFEMEALLKKVEQNKIKNQIFDQETFEMVQDGYEGFREYLNE